LFVITHIGNPTLACCAFVSHLT